MSNTSIREPHLRSGLLFWSDLCYAGRHMSTWANFICIVCPSDATMSRSGSVLSVWSSGSAMQEATWRSSVVCTCRVSSSTNWRDWPLYCVSRCQSWKKRKWTIPIRTPIDDVVDRELVIYQSMIYTATHAVMIEDSQSTRLEVLTACLRARKCQCRASGRCTTCE